MAPVYSWVVDNFPRDNTVTAPDGAHKAVCKGTDRSGHLWAGYWGGVDCVGAYGGSSEHADGNLRFLNIVSGSAQWVSGTGKAHPNNVGATPPDTINAGSTFTGAPQVLCSQDGYVGWVSQNSCELFAPPGVNRQANVTVLVGVTQ